MARIPWVKVRIDLPSSDKVAGLPGAEVPHPAWGFVCLLAAAKTQRRMGVFAGRSHLAAVVSQAAPFIDLYTEAGSLHVAPALCDECALRHAGDDLKAGELVVHDYLKEQRDPTNADRQEAHRAEQKLRALTQALEDAGIDVQLVAGTKARVTPDTVTPSPDGGRSTAQDVTAVSVTETPGPIEPARRNGDVTPHSRARGTTVTVTETETTTPTTKKNGSDGTVSVANEARDPDPFLSDPNRAGRPRASAAPRPLTVPAGIAAATPRWRHACTDYVHHQTQHRIVDGEAVCPPCEAKLAEAVTPPAVTPPGGSQDGFGLA
jgi:hypothetical protein